MRSVSLNLESLTLSPCVGVRSLSLLYFGRRTCGATEAGRAEWRASRKENRPFSRRINFDSSWSSANNSGFIEFVSSIQRASSERARPVLYGLSLRHTSLSLLLSPSWRNVRRLHMAGSNIKGFICRCGARSPEARVVVSVHRRAVTTSITNRKLNQKVIVVL